MGDTLKWHFLGVHMMRTHQIWGNLGYGVVSEADPTAVGPWKSGHAWVARRGLVTGRPGCEGFPGSGGDVRKYPSLVGIKHD